MAQKIKSSDIFEGDLTAKQIKEFEALIGVMDKMEVQIKDILKAQSDKVKVDKQDYDNIVKTEKQLQEMQKTEKALLQTQREKAKLQKDLIAKTNAEVTLRDKQQRIADRQAKAQLGLNSAYSKQSKKLNELRKQYKDLIITQGKETKQTKAMRKEMQKLDAQLKKVDAAAGQFQRSVGNYGKALGGLGSLAKSALPIAGFTGLVSVVGNAVSIFRDFEKANSQLKAVSGATDEQMAAMKDTAMQLGASTAFTASEVAGLQTEFAKLGFSVDEIQNATGATLDLAAASGTELAEAAAVAGSTLGGFQMGAEETQRVVDVMAKSFSTSALDMEKFRESMKDAAPAAAAVGLTIEETTAMLGTLSNAGISGSKAGTALKSSFINLNKAGISLDKAFEKVANSSDKLGTATELVGKNAAASFLVLAEGTDTTEKLKKGFDNARGAAKKMADVQLDNLAGDMTKLGSAWEGFILGIEKGDGALNNMLRGLTQLGAKILGALTPTKDLSEEWFNSRDALNDLENSLNPMLDRYDELAEKTELTKDEQKELDDIILKVAEDIPSAVTQFDEYGKAMGISTEAAKAFIKEQKDMLALSNAEEIEKQQDAISDLTAKLRTYNLNLQVSNTLRRTDAGGWEELSISYTKSGTAIKEWNKLSDSEILRRSKVRQEIQAEIKLREAVIAKLRGEKTEAEKAAEAEKKANAAATGSSNTTSIEKQLNTIEKIKKELKELEQQKEDLVKRDGDNLIIDNEELKAKNEEIKKLNDELINAKFLLAGLEESYDNMEFRDMTSSNFSEQDAPSPVPLPDEEEIEEAENHIEEYTQLVTALVEKMTDKRIEAIDREIEANQRRQETLRRLAEEGNQDANNNLAQEEKRQAELEKMKEQAVRRQKQIELGLSVLQTYSANAADPDVKSPLAKTIADTQLLIQFVQSLPAFYEGTDDTGKGGKLDNKGGFHAILHPNEQVWSAADREEVGFRSRNQIKDIVQSYDRLHDPRNAMQVIDDSRIVTKLDEIANKPTYLGRDYDATEGAIIDVVIKRGRMERNHRNTGKKGLF